MPLTVAPGTSFRICSIAWSTRSAVRPFTVTRAPSAASALMKVSRRQRGDHSLCVRTVKPISSRAAAMMSRSAAVAPVGYSIPIPR